jgi:hypothetical protein
MTRKDGARLGDDTKDVKEGKKDWANTLLIVQVVRDNIWRGSAERAEEGGWRGVAQSLFGLYVHKTDKSKTSH